MNLRQLKRNGLCAIAAFCAYLPLQSHAMDIGECMAGVEAMDHAIIESHMPESTTQPLEAKLNQAVEACEGGEMGEGSRYLEQATALYDTLIETGPHGLSDADFWGAADYMWGNNSYKRNVNFMHVKMNDDINTDMVGWKLNFDNPDGPFYQLIAVVKTLDGQLQKAHISIPFNRDTQISLCSMDNENIPEPSLTHAELNTGEGLEISGLDVADYMLTINDEMCDALHIFWPKAAIGEEVDFIIHRN
jgi:hypothetical protein